MSGAQYDDGFGDSFGSAPALVSRRADTGQATQIEQARAIAEVKAMVLIAMENPRNEERSREKMRRVCSMPALAERAFFRVQRGTKKDENGRTLKDASGKAIPDFVNGETINLARELARCWGNILYSAAEMSRDEVKGQSEMLAYAWDLEENVRPSAIFIVNHKMGTYRVTSNQQIYENNASHAGRRLREMIFNALPEWFKAEAIDLCHETLKKGNGKPMSERITACIEAYREIGVTVDMIQRRIGRSPREMQPEDLASLGIVLKSIKRGEVNKDEEFPAAEIAEDQTKTIEHSAGGSKLDKMENSIKQDTPDPIAGMLAHLATIPSVAAIDKWKNLTATREAVKMLSEADTDRLNAAVTERKKGLPLTTDAAA